MRRVRTCAGLGGLEKGRTALFQHAGRTAATTSVLGGAVLASACALWQPPPPPGIGKPVPFDELPGWGAGEQAASLGALLRGCEVLAQRDHTWQMPCDAARAVPAGDDAAARRFYESYFDAHPVFGAGGARDGLITGYYEPLLQGSREPDRRFRYPLYRRPADLVTVDLDALYPELEGMRLRGRLVGNRVVPYYSRHEIREFDPLAGQELLWVDDPVDLFFLHVQGSGRVRLRDGSTVGVGYADQNGHPYRSIGRTLVQRGDIERDAVTLFTIRDWIRHNPSQAAALLDSNPSYVFFALRETPEAGPRGSLNVALTAGRSVAVDPSVIPLGAPVWLDTTLPGTDGTRWRRLLLAQDTGGAIKGPVRADVFFGHGEQAERLAGEMKNPGQLHVLLPRSPDG